MAGIGFKLRRYTEDGSYFGMLQGYTFSAIIVAGPWLLLILTLGSVAVFSRGEMSLFHVTLMYIFSFSLIYLGLFQFVLTRFLADRLYAGEIDLHIPAFLGSLVVALTPQAIAAAVFLYFVEASVPFLVVAYVTHLVINTIWIVLFFLGVLRAYMWVVWSFLIGGVISVAVSLGLGVIGGQTGYLAGFMSGQVVTLSMLLWLLLSEFPWEKGIDFSFLSYFRRYPSLAFLGALYYLSTWIDKLVMRTTEAGVLLAPKLMWAAPDYEVASFVAQLTILPALALFFIRVETGFFEAYRDFFSAIANHQPLSVIQDMQRGVVRSVRSGLEALLTVQGTITLVVVLLAPQIFNQLAFDETKLRMLRVLVLGSFLQTMLFLVVILMLYFEHYSEAVRSCVLFLVTNGVLTWLFSRVERDLAGWGFSIGAAVALIHAIAAFRRLLQRLPEVTFMRQLQAPSGPGLVHDEGIAFYHRGQPGGRALAGDS